MLFDFICMILGYMFLYSLVQFWMKYLHLKLAINGDKGLSENAFLCGVSIHYHNFYLYAYVLELLA